MHHDELFATFGNRASLPERRKRMNMITRRRFLTVLAAVPTMSILASACGSDGGSDAGSEPQGTDGSSPDSTPKPAQPADPNAAVLRIDTGVGAFTTPEYSFGSLPSLLVVGDGRAFRPGAQIEIFPPPMLFPVEQLKVSDDQVAKLMNLADEAGLFGEIPNYEVGQPNVTDIGAAIVTLVKDGKEYVHNAYALGFDGESGEPRRNLKKFVEEAISMDLGAGEQYVPEQYAIWARPMSLADFAGADPQPTVVPWPVASIDLKTADTCLVVNGADVQVAFEAGNFQTLWDQGGATYAIAVRTMLPGGDPCA
jgi:hypothetical protein